MQGYFLPLTPDCEYCQRMTRPLLFCAPWVSLISFSIPTLAAGAGTIPSRAGFIPSMSNTLISPHMIPWNGHVNGLCCLDPMPLQIMTLCMVHSVYNDKVSEIGEVPKLLNRLLDCHYTPLGRTNQPWWFKQDDLCRAEFLDDFLDNFLLKL
jgi:hypothetical protein